MPRTSDPRFRIEVFDRATGWEAKVYDHEDHGHDVAYAGVTAGDLDRVLDYASHYVLVAVADASREERHGD